MYKINSVMVLMVCKYDALLCLLSAYCNTTNMFLPSKYIDKTSTISTKSVYSSCDIPRAEAKLFSLVNSITKTSMG